MMLRCCLTAALIWVPCWILADDEIAVRSIQIRLVDASGKPIHTITLTEAASISGMVVDDATGQPIENARFVTVTHYPQRPNDPIVQRSQVIPSDAGAFEYTQTHFHNGTELVLQFEAKGYRPKRIGPFNSMTGTSKYEVRLQRAPQLRGQVVDRDGNPVEGANVSFTTKDTSLIARDWTYRSAGLSTQTGSSGNFELDPTLNPPVIIATHISGYAEVALQLDQQPGQLRLQPWSRVEGKLTRAGEPAVGVRVFLNPIRMLGGDNPHVQDSFQVLTDNQGRFAFPRVPPVPSSLWPYVSVWSDTKLSSGRHVPLDLKPGAAHQITLSDGVVVRGNVQPSGELASQLDMNYCLNYLLKREPGITPPPPIAKAGLDWQDGWSFNLCDTQEGRGFLSTLPHHFVKFQSDGSFEIHGVEPGEYQFAISIYEPPEGCLIDPVGRDVVKFRVEDDAVKRGSLDLGTIAVDVKLGPQVGDAFPNFRFTKATDDETGFISEFRGKYVLLDFWSTWCGPCIKQLPEVERVATRWGGDRAVVVSVSLDERLDQAREFIRNEGMNWPQALLGERDSPIVRQQLGISSVPIHYVLDPDGKILLRAFRLEEAVKLIDEELAED